MKEMSYKFGVKGRGVIDDEGKNGNCDEVTCTG